MADREPIAPTACESDILKDLEDAASGFGFVLTVNDHERVIELLKRAAAEIRHSRISRRP